MPDISMVVPLAKTLNVSTDYLFGLEKNEIDDNVYVELKRHIEKIETESGRKAEAALLSCQFMLKKVYEAPDNYIYSVFFCRAGCKFKQICRFGKICRGQMG